MNFTEELEHPARYYIYYLFSRRKYRAHEIVGLLRRQNMPVPIDEGQYAIFYETLSRIQSRMVYPPNFDPSRAKTHAPTAEWLHKHRIYDMWVGEPNVMNAFDLLDAPALRRSLEIMLLGPLALGDIARRLCAVHGVDSAVLNIGSIRYFAHYFWNMECVPAIRQPEILRQMQGDSEDYFAVYNAPRSQVGASMSLYIATRGGSGVPKEAEMFKYMRDCSFMEFIKTAATRYPGMGKASAMQSLMSCVISAQEQVDMRRGGSAELMDHLRRLETRYDDRTLTSAADLPLHTLAENNRREMEDAS
jgi:hypothetical protein